MTDSTSDRPVRWLSRGVRLLLLAAPAPFRERFGEEMEDAVVAGWLERPRGLGRIGFAVRSAWSVLKAGVAERIRPTYETSETGRTGMGVGGWMGAVRQDVRLALRGALRQPVFTLVLVSTLALGIGVNTAIFSVVNGVLLRPLDYADSEGLVWVNSDWTGPDGGLSNMSYPDLEDLNREVPAFERLVGYSTSSMTLTGMGEAEIITTARLTDGLMGIFRQEPVLGRDIRADEFGADAPRVVVVSYGFWQERFGGASDVLGRTIVLSGVSHEVVGVAPEGHSFPGSSELWVPRRMDPESCGRGCHGMSVVGRLAPGASVAAANIQSRALADRLREEYRDTNLYKSFRIQSLQDATVGSVRTGLYLMLGAVGLVLLIACANVATLLLVRGASRVGDTAVRSALGASRGRLIGQSVVESAVLAAIGAAGGLVLAYGIVGVLPSLAVDRIPRIADVAIDGRVLAFALGSLVLVAALFGLVPAAAVSRRHTRVSSASRGGTGGRRERSLQSWLLAGEVALCTILLVASGLLVRTFQELYSAELGYETEDILRFNLSLPSARYESLEEIHGFYRSLEERIRGLPGVVAAGSAWSAPLSRGNATGTVYVQGRPEPTVEEERDGAIHSVTPGWLETMGIRLIQGRTLTEADAFGGEAVALINQRMVDEHFPDTDPIGQVMRVSVDFGFGEPWFRVVGVIPDLRERTLTETGVAGIWVPMGHFGPESLSVSVRTEPGASPVLPAIREIVASMDGNLPLYRIETMEEAVFRQIAPTRFYVILTATFALLAAVLAAVGLYGVAAFAAARRTREIGLRVALGADRGGILRLVVGQGMRPALWGLVLGLAGAYLTTGLLQTVLYGVAPRDPAVFVGAGLLLGAVAWAAAVLPARVAARTDPMVALRTE